MPTRFVLQTARIAWLFIIIALVTAVIVQRPAVDTSVMSLLPHSQQQPLVKKAAETMGKQFSQRLLLLVSSDNKDELQPAITDIVETLQPLPQVASVLWQINANDTQQLQQSLFAYRYVLLTDTIKKLLEAGDTGTLRQQALSRVVNPISLGGVNLKQDPFGLFTSWQASQTPALNVVIDDGYIRVNATKHTYLVILNLKDDAFKIATQRAILNQLDQVQLRLEKKQVSITASGLLIHADAGAKQAQLEMSTIGLGSLLGIVLLMFCVFRRFSSVVLLMLPLFVGCLVATSAAFLVFKQVHIITFAFGAGLIGVAIDYALHFLCERRQRKAVLAYIMPGLALGLISSVLAYAALAITPFPGLRQMAVFSVVGLIAAWLTVTLWYPVLTRRHAIESLPAAQKLQHWQQVFPSLQTSPWVLPVLLALALLSLVTIAMGNAEDDIRLLQTSSADLVGQETHVQQLLGLQSSTQFLLLACEKKQSCLEKEAQIKPSLEQMKTEGVLTEYQLVSDRLPALKQQEQNASLVENLYQKQLSPLFQQLNLPEKARQQALNEMRANLGNRLTWLEAKHFLDNGQNAFIETDKQGIATIIRLSSDKPLSKQSFNQLQQVIPELILVDQVAAI